MVNKTETYKEDYQFIQEEWIDKCIAFIKNGEPMPDQKVFFQVNNKVVIECD